MRAEPLSVAKRKVCAAQGAFKEALQVEMPDKSQVAVFGVSHADADGFGVHGHPQ